jgi:hypothetical protein
MILKKLHSIDLKKNQVQCKKDLVLSRDVISY